MSTKQKFHLIDCTRGNNSRSVVFDSWNLQPHCLIEKWTSGWAIRYMNSDGEYRMPTAVEKGFSTEQDAFAAVIEWDRQECETP
jgi:hypothetical protein